MMITLRTVMNFRAWGEKEEASHRPRWKEHFKTSKQPKPTYYTSIRMTIPSSNRMANIITQAGEHVIHLNVFNYADERFYLSYLPDSCSIHCKGSILVCTLCW